MHDRLSRRVGIPFLILLLSTAAAEAATFPVDSPRDEQDVAPGDGICASSSGACTLRAAIEEANAFAGPDQIVIPAGKYKLNDGLASGIHDDLTITGAGADLTTVKGTRAFAATLVVLPGIDATISDLTIARSRPYAVDNRGTLLLERVTLTKNANGGLVNSGTVTVRDVTILRNRAPQGAGILNRGTASLTNVTIAKNRSAHYAGGIYGHTAGSHLEMNNVTLTTNRCIYSCAANLNIAGDGTAIVRNTIVTGRRKINCEVPPGISAGHNLAIDSTCAFTEPSDLSDTDPRLFRLRFNDGAMRTAAPRPDSPAIDSGDDATCAATDQRGVARPQGAACDRGAVEVVP